MAWKKPKYNKNELNKAGLILKDSNSSDEETAKATEILNNWRAIHGYPLHIFQMRLKNISKKCDKEALIAQRLKRATSIINKLNRKYEGRNPSMQLSQMRDIAGCRAIVKNVEIAKKIGYRSLHIIYEYKSDKGKTDYNGLRVEVQIRSRLQHLWATAIETVDFFTRQAIKFNEGRPDWADFFKLVSSAFAISENCPVIQNTPPDKRELYLKIKEKEKELGVINRMAGWTSAMKFFNEEVKSKMKGKAKFFLLELDILR